MAWISLICLLALSSSAFGGYAYSSMPAARELGSRRSFQSRMQPALQSFSAQASLPRSNEFLSQPINDMAALPIALPVPTDADNLCRGQVAETIIPIDNNRKFIVCLGKDKGVEQSCPRGLVFHTELRRCERNLDKMDNVCISQPCLHNGQCVPTAYHYQCTCPAGFDGKNCELDARVCQTQNPCGQSTDYRCQSFRVGAALSHICVHVEGLSYGLSSQQVFPNPCRGEDGTTALANTDKGFIMCDGDRMSLESCPGSTVWEDTSKACVWPDTEVVPQKEQSKSISYGDYESRSLSPKSSYSSPMIAHEQPRVFHSYAAPAPKLAMDKPKLGRVADY